LLALCLLGSLLAACVSIPDEHRRPVVVMNSAIRVTPDSEYLRGKLLHLQSRYDEAQQAYLSALTMNKDHPEARNGIAALLGARGDLDRSIALLTGMAQSGTRLPQVYVNLGHAWLKKGQLAQARTALERALELDPDSQAAQEKMAALRIAENPVSVQLAEQAIVPDAATASAVVTLNPIEALGEGLYVLRYTLPVSDIAAAPASAQRSAGAAQDKTVTNLIEQTADLTPASVQPDIVVNWVPSGSVPTLAIEVANGNGVQGLARSLRGLMAGQSWRVVRTTNHQQFGVRFTRIEYALDRAQDARTLADTLGIDAKFRSNNQQTGTQLRIILGHDLKDLSAIRQRFTAAAETKRTSHTLQALPEMHSSVH
jgi:hypothetical protein